MNRLTDEQRDRVARMLPIAKHIATRAAKAKRMSYAEALSAASLGLVAAMGTYKPGCGTTPETHAYRRAWHQVQDDRRRATGYKKHTKRYPPLAIGGEAGSTLMRGVGVRDADPAWLVRDAFMDRFGPLVPLECREVLAMYYVDEMSCREIGKRLGCATGTAWSRLSVAREWIRRANGY